MKEMERIWLYTHPDAKIEDAMKEITIKEEIVEKLEEKPKDNFFSKLKSSLNSMFYMDDESETNQE